MQCRVEAALQVATLCLGCVSISSDAPIHKQQTPLLHIMCPFYSHTLLLCSSCFSQLSLRSVALHLFSLFFSFTVLGLCLLHFFALRSLAAVTCRNHMHLFNMILFPLVGTDWLLLGFCLVHKVRALQVIIVWLKSLQWANRKGRSLCRKRRVMKRRGSMVLITPQPGWVRDTKIKRMRPGKTRFEQYSADHIIMFNHVSTPGVFFDHQHIKLIMIP